MVQKITKQFTIEYNAPYPDSIEDSSNWLCKENLQLLLTEGTTGTLDFKVLDEKIVS